MIHPNEWNNIPACIRSAIMGLIDFNDKMTQKLAQEDTILLHRIQALDDKTTRAKHEVLLKCEDLDKKIEREIMKALRTSRKQHEEMTKAQQQMVEQQEKMHDAVQGLNDSQSKWQTTVKTI